MSEVGRYRRTGRPSRRVGGAVSESDLADEVRKLRRALALYADRKNWRDDGWGVSAIFDAEYGNPGRRARAVLDRLDKQDADAPQQEGAQK